MRIGEARGTAARPPHRREARPIITSCENPLAEAPATDRLLVLRLGAVGDVVRTLPAASALRDHYPDARLAWLVEPGAQSLLEAVPWIDEVLVFPRGELREGAQRGDFRGVAGTFRRFVQALRGGRFDTVVDFHAILKSGLLAKLSGAPRRVTYAPPFSREGSYHFATHRARLGQEKRSRFERNLALVRFLGISRDPRPAPVRGGPRREARRDSEPRTLQRRSPPDCHQPRHEPPEPPTSATPCPATRRLRGNWRIATWRRSSPGGPLPENANSRKGSSPSPAERRRWLRRRHPWFLWPRSSRAHGYTSGATPGPCTWPRSSGHLWSN